MNVNYLKHKIILNKNYQKLFYFSKIQKILHVKKSNIYPLKTPYKILYVKFFSKHPSSKGTTL